MAGHTWCTWLLLASVLAGCATGGPSAPGPSSPGAASAASPAATDAPVTARTHAPAATPEPPASPPPSTPVPSTTPAPTAKPTVRPTPRPSPTSTASTAPPPITFKPGQVAVVTATEGVRMRTKPGVGSDSDRFKPMLPKGTDLYVISGPKHGSGYHWYEVSPITFRVSGVVEWPDTLVGPQSTGWVPVASRGGEAWLAHGKATCPERPKDVIALASLSTGARLACFSTVPITLQARLLPHSCDVLWGGEMKPAWFQGAFEGLTLVPTTATTVPPGWGCDTSVLFLHLDPEGTHPVRLPVDKVVTVTGMFDHPAAASCTFKEWDGNNAFTPTEACRSEFAVTSIR